MNELRIVKFTACRILSGIRELTKDLFNEPIDILFYFMMSELVSFLICLIIVAAFFQGHWAWWLVVSVAIVGGVSPVCILWRWMKSEYYEDQHRIINILKKD